MCMLGRLRGRRISEVIQSWVSCKEGWEMQWVLLWFEVFGLLFIFSERLARISVESICMHLFLILKYQLLCLHPDLPPKFGKCTCARTLT